ncbi:MAG: tetratricopeptide repeat protein [Myxococcota bacterium]
MSIGSKSKWPSSSAVRLSDRDTEFKVAFERATLALTRGEAQIINLIGDRGMGKSRLIEEILERLAAPPFPEIRLVRVEAWAGNRGEPLERLLVAAFQSENDVDERIARQRLRTELTRCARETGLDAVPFLLARVLYQGGSDMPLLQALAENESPHPRMAAELLACLWARLSEEKPLVLVIEDLQFCPQATIEFVRHLSHCLSGSVLLLVSSRVDEFKWVSPEAERMCTLTLDPLPPAQCLEIVRDQLGFSASNPPAALVDACQKLSVGVGVQQALRMLESRGAFKRTTDPEHPIEYDDNRIGYVVNLLLAERAQHEGAAHDAARAYLTSARFALAARQPNWSVTLVEAAMQLLGSSPSWETALAQEQRGQVLRLVGKSEDALAAFQEMALLANRIEEPWLLAKAHENLGRTYRDRGELLLARQHLDLALASFQALDSAGETAATHEDLARLDVLDGDYQRAHDHIMSALEWAVETSNEHARAHALTVYAAALLEDGERPQALTALEVSIELCRVLHDTHGMTENLFLLGRLAEQEGELLRALELFFDAVDLARKLDHFAALPDVWIDIADCQQHLGNLDDAARSLANAEGLLLRFPNKLSLAELRRVEAKLELRSENSSAACLAAQTSVLLYRQTQCRAGLAGALRTLGEALAAEERRDDGLVSRCFVEAVGLGKAIHNQQQIAKTYYAFAKFALRAPEYAEHQAIRSEAVKLRAFAGELFAAQRVGLDPDTWFELRMNGLSLYAPDYQQEH